MPDLRTATFGPYFTDSSHSTAAPSGKVAAKQLTELLNLGLKLGLQSPPQCWVHRSPRLRGPDGFHQHSLDAGPKPRRHHQSAHESQRCRRIHQKSLQVLAAHLFICALNRELGPHIGIHIQEAQSVTVNKGEIRLQVIEDNYMDSLAPENVEISLHLADVIGELAIAY